VAFSEEAILDKLNNLKVNKSPGPDSVHTCILYEVGYQIVTPLFIMKFVQLGTQIKKAM